MAIPASAHTLLYQALAQNDVDMQFHKLLNLDTSNLEELGAPPTIHPPVNQWLHDWDNATHAWTATQPRFRDLAENLTLGVGGQQRAITELGTINVGTWQGGIIAGAYLATLNQIRAPLPSQHGEQETHQPRQPDQRAGCGHEILHGLSAPGTQREGSSAACRRR
jgi:hypothetical protein